jgi:hypothetical protein
MKKILKEWKQFLKEEVVAGNKQMDEGAPYVTLYHVGWKTPDTPFESNKEFYYSGEPKPKYGKRPMGGEALYCATSRKGALRYSQYSKLSYLYEIQYPTSDMAGKLNPKWGASEEVQQMYIDNLKSKQYGAKFEDIRMSSGFIEVAIYDVSKIKEVSHEALFDEDDVYGLIDKLRDNTAELEEMVSDFVGGDDFYEKNDIQIEISRFENIGKKRKEEMRQMLDLEPKEVQGYLQRFKKAKEKFENYTK